MPGHDIIVIGTSAGGLKALGAIVGPLPADGVQVASDQKTPRLVFSKQLRLPEADRQEIQAEFEKLVAEPEMKSIASNNHLPNSGRQTFIDFVITFT